MLTLLGHLDPRIEVSIVGVDRELTKWFAGELPRARVYWIPPVRDKRDVRGIRSHLRLIRTLRPDVLQVHLPTPWSGKYALLAGLLTPGVKVIAVDHTGMPPFNRQAVWAKRFLMRTTAANVAISAELARFVEEASGLRSGSVRVIYNGIADLGPPASPRQRHDPPVVGTIARLTMQKGVDVLLRALARVPNVRGVIVGDGDAGEELHRLATELGIGERITWTGWRDDTRALFESFDVFVLPSRFEGLGRVLVEAELAECPVVSTRVVGTSEAMMDGVTGLLVPAEDPAALARAISTLLDDEGRAREMGRRGRAFALQRFDPSASARAYESLYEEVLGRQRVRAPSP